MASLNTIVIFASLLVSARCYIITNKDPVFPVQEILNDNSFIRILPNQEVNIVECPPGTYLDKVSLTCQFKNVEALIAVGGDDCTLIPNGPPLPNPNSCRSFILCGAAGTFFMDCPSNLLFNNAQGYCDYPNEADCCEFFEKNSSRLVQNSF